MQVTFQPLPFWSHHFDEDIKNILRIDCFLSSPAFKMRYRTIGGDFPTLGVGGGGTEIRVINRMKVCGKVKK